MPDTAAPLTALDRFSEAVTAARADFERLYDELMRSHAPTVQALPFKLVAVGTRGDRAAYRAAFETAQEQRWLEPLMLAALEAGIVGNRKPDSSPPEAAVQAELQAFVSHNLGLARPELLASGILRSIRRVCRVLVDDGETSTGTGFLIGPQTVITCWHVVKDLIGNDRHPLDRSATRLTVEFDGVGGMEEIKVRVADRWLDLARPCNDGEAPAGAERWALAPPLAAMKPECLDFAVLRLARTVGRERGFQRLDKNCWPDTAKRFYVFQHPHQYRQRLGDSPNSRWHDESMRLRLIHKANTGDGSSGGLCVDDAFRTVALHQCALKDGDGKPIGNGAVPTAHIASVQGIEAALVVDPTLDPLWRLPDTGEPVIGRTSFQKLVWDLVAGQARILVVRGAPRSGKSFSRRILRGMLPPGERAVIERAAVEVPGDPLEFAVSLLRELESAERAAAAPPLPDPQAGATTNLAWIRDELLPILTRRLEEATTGRTVWLVIDDLEHHTLPDTGSRVLLELLYQRIANYPWLRILLIGLSGTVPGAVFGTVEEDTVPVLTAEDVSLWIQRYATAVEEAGADPVPNPITVSEADRLGAIADRVMRSCANTNEALAVFVRDILRPTLPLLPSLKRSA